MTLSICFISTHAYPLFNPRVRTGFGGAEVQLYNLACAFSNLPQTQVSFIVGDFGQLREETRHKIRLIKSFTLNRRFRYISGIPAQFKLWRALKKANADIYIQRAAGLETGLVAAFCKLYRKKFVYMTAHERDCDGSYAKDFGLVGQLFQWGLLHSTQIITQSEDHKNLLKKTYDKEGVVMPSVYEIPNQSPKKTQEILWVARAVDWKQPEIFVKLAESLPKYHFVMICPEDLNRKYFLHLKKSTQKIQNLKFTNRVPFHKIDDYFKRARIFVNTSAFEGFPNTFIQAAKNRTPIVSWIINPDNVLKRYRFGLVANRSFLRLKKAVLELMENKKRWQGYSQAAFDYAKKNHDINQVVAKLNQLWRADVHQNPDTKIHIAFINRGVGLYQGGGERYDLSLAKALKERGHKVSFITGRPVFAKPKFQLELPTVFIKSPYLRELSYLLPKGWVFNWLDGALFDRAVRRFLKSNPYFADVYQVSGWPVLAARLIKETKKPVVLRMPGPAREVIDLQDDLTTIVANGDAFRQMQPKVKQRIHNIPPAVDNKNFYRSMDLRKQWRDRLGLTPNRVCLIYSGRLVPIKNPVLMIEGFANAYQKNQNLRLVMAGAGPLIERLNKQAQNLGAAQAIKFLGHQTVQNLNGLYNASDILVIPSRYDNYPNTVLEATAVGLPIIGTKVGGIPTQITHRHNGLLVPSEDSSVLAEAILELAHSSSRRKKMTQVAQTLTQGYTWDTVGQQFEKLYQKELKRKQ